MNAHELQSKAEQMTMSEETLRQGERLIWLALNLKACRRHSQAARRSYVANDRTSRIASRVFRLRQSEAERYDDLDAFHAPGECALVTAKQIAREEAAILSDYGTTAEAWNRLLTDRCDSDQANELGLYILGDDPYGYTI